MNRWIIQGHFCIGSFIFIMKRRLYWKNSILLGQCLEIDQTDKEVDGWL